MFRSILTLLLFVPVVFCKNRSLRSNKKRSLRSGKPGKKHEKKMVQEIIELRKDDDFLDISQGIAPLWFVDMMTCGKTDYAETPLPFALAGTLFTDFGEIRVPEEEREEWDKEDKKKYKKGREPLWYYTLECTLLETDLEYILGQIKPMMPMMVMHSDMGKFDDMVKTPPWCDRDKKAVFVGKLDEKSRKNMDLRMGKDLAYVPIAKKADESSILKKSTSEEELSGEQLKITGTVQLFTMEEGMKKLEVRKAVKDSAIDLPGMLSCNIDACLGLDDNDTRNCIYLRYSGYLETRLNVKSLPFLDVEVPPFIASVISGTGRFAGAMGEAEVALDFEKRGEIDLRYFPSDDLSGLWD